MASLEKDGVLAADAQGLQHMDERLQRMSSISDSRSNGTDEEHASFIKRIQEVAVERCHYRLPRTFYQECQRKHVRRQLPLYLPGSVQVGTF